jgi:hypothetical protein
MFKKKPSPPDGPSPLYPAMEKFVREETEKLDREFLTPWAFFNTDTPLEVKDFHNCTIRVGATNLEFSGSIRDVYWGSIAPFLEDIAVRAIDETVRRGSGRPDLAKSLNETRGMLISYSRKTLTRMADIDRRLRGKGFPKTVELQSTTCHEREIEGRINVLVDAQVRLIPPTKRWWQDELLLKWVALGVTLLGILVTVIVNFSS